MNKEKNHIKRFCFAGNKMSQLEHNQISFYAKLKSDNRLSEMGIVNLDIFKNDLFCFFVLDIQIHLSLDDLKILLEQKMKTYPELKFLFELINLEKIKEADPVIEISKNKTIPCSQQVVENLFK